MPHTIASTYEILQRLGSGGGGIVYLGQHLRLGKKIVLKADKRKLSDMLDEAHRREVDALKNLSHTYIPQVYDFVAEDDIVYTVIDYIEGESFDKPLGRGVRFSQPQIIEWACQLLDALCYLHSPHPELPYGILHSDIKPANIMLTPQGDIRLIDFNIALALGEEGAVAVGRSLGYASPEHYGIIFTSGGIENREDPTVLMGTGIQTGSETETVKETRTMPKRHSLSSGSGTGSKKTIVLDVRSDIYGLGATLYHLLTGFRPAQNAKEVIPLSKMEFSPGIVSIINKAMNPIPEKRYQTAVEMLYDLNHLHQTDPRVKRHKRVRLAIGLPLVALFVSGVFASFVGLKQMEQIQSAYASAEYSASALSEGDASLAVSLALEALPARNSIFVPPYTSQAKKALSDALGIYDLSDKYKPYKTLKLPSEAFKIEISGDGKTAAAVYAYEVAVINLSTAEITAKLPAVPSALAGARFLSDTILVYAGENGICAYDITKQEIMWTGKPATEIAVSADQSTIAAVYKDESNATIYDADGTEKAVVSFDGNKQRVAANDTFANPGDNLLALNNDGSWLAVSFADGMLNLYDLNDEDNMIELFDPSDFYHFEGGFSDIYFAFSATGKDSSVFAVIDTEEIEQTGGFESDRKFGVLANESGIFVSSDNIIVKLDPVTGDQSEIAYTDSDVLGFAVNRRFTIAATEDNGYMFFDEDANRLAKYNGNYSCDFVGIGDDFAFTGGRNTPVLRILERDDCSDTQIFSYDRDYIYDELRVNADFTRVMLFSYEGFRLYDISGRLLCEEIIPEAAFVCDQQYSKASGNLSAIYKDALRIYSGDSGALLYEKTDLKSVFYAPYGISILEDNGVISLIDIDNADITATYQAGGGFAAFCGIVVDDTFLAGRELIGAAEHGEGYLFAVSDGTRGAVYNEKAKKLFEVSSSGTCEAFFTDNTVVISPLHGTPVAYNLKTGKKVRDLERDAYLTYITKYEGYVVSEYISTNNERYAVLLDASSMEAVAYLPWLTDIVGDKLLFDFQSGILRESRIYSIDELIETAEEGGF